MLKITYRSGLTIVLGVLGLSALSARGQHQGDVIVGVTAGGQLSVSTNGLVPANWFVALPPADGVLQGFSSDEPGFDHVENDELDPLGAGSAIWIEVIEMDPAFQVINKSLQALQAPGDDTFIGGADLHTHLTWHINNQDPAFDPEQCVWRATFLLRDDGTTGYTPSEPLAFSFTNVPVRALGVPATGDFDESGMIDEADCAARAACLEGGGPERLPGPYEPGVTTCAVECLNAFDFDDDRDVDLADVAAFQRAIP